MNLHRSYIVKRLKCSDAHASKILGVIDDYFYIRWSEASHSFINSTIDDAVDFYNNHYPEVIS